MNRLIISHNLKPTDVTLSVPFDTARFVEFEKTKIDECTFEIKLIARLDHSISYEIIPCFSMLSDLSYSYQVMAKVGTQEIIKENVAFLTTIGEADSVFQNIPNENNNCLKTDIDVFMVNSSNAVEVIFRIKYDSSSTVGQTEEQWIATLCVAPVQHSITESIPIRPVNNINVPVKSQMLEDETIQRRICSPTCVSMVIDYYSHLTSVLEVSKLSYNKKHDMYGIWPQSIWAASKYGILGYLYKFNNWNEVHNILANKIPIIASINYRDQELSNAAIAETPGHLVVLKGFNKNEVFVNDPASKTLSKVSRRYCLRQFTDIWLHKKAVGYILFKPIS